MQLVFDLLDELLDGSTAPLLGIGIGTPGLVDSRTGTIRRAVNLDWRDLPLGAIVASATACPVNVANDSQAAALAEYTYAGGDRVPNLIAIRVGRGVGAGLILRGALFQGDGSGAGEIGHVVVDDDGELCRCGRTGCLETVAGMRAIEARAAAATGRPTDLAALRAAIADSGEPWATADRRRRRRRARQGDRRPDRRPRRPADRPPRSRDRARRCWLDAVRREAGSRALALLADDVDIPVAGRRRTS